MKKFFLLFFILLTISNIRSFDEKDSSLILIITDQNGESFFSSMSLNKLKQCAFPISQIRNNELSSCDFKNISKNIVDKVKDSINSKEYLGLHSFCIDAELNGLLSKTCAFSVPDKADLCYVFKFENPIKDIMAAILNNDQLNDLNIDIATSDFDPENQAPVNEKPVSKIQKYCMDFGVKVFIVVIDMIEKGKLKIEEAKSTCNKLIDYLRNLYAKHL